jgi:hypothetical protein
VANFNASSLEPAIPLVAGIVGILIGFGKTTSVSTLRSETSKKILRWVSPVLVVSGLFLFISNCASGSGDANIIATEIKTKLKLPARVDDDTRLDDVRAISKTELGYFLTLTRVTKLQLDANPIATQLESNLRAALARIRITRISSKRESA